MKKRDRQEVLKSGSEIYRSGKAYPADVHEFPTFHCPIIYRSVIGRGYYPADDGRREYFTPEPSEVPTRHRMSRNIIRPACFPAVICGVTLRNIAAIFAVLFQVPVTESGTGRRINGTGSRLSEEDIPGKPVGQRKPQECRTDACYPPGTDRCVTVIGDDCGRIPITHESDSENAADAEIFLKKLKDSGMNTASAFSDCSESFISAVKEVFPEAEFQADHFHTAENIRKYLKKALPEYRREVGAAGEKEKNAQLTEIVSELRKLRRVLLKKPSDLSAEEREQTEKKDAGFIKKFRSVIRQITNFSDHSNTEAQAEIRSENLKNRIGDIENGHLGKICGFSDGHRDEAMQYLRKRGPGKYGRSSDSESGMRVLGRPEKNHDGIRSEAARKNYIKIYQTVKYLSEDVTRFPNPLPGQICRREPMCKKWDIPDFYIMSFASVYLTIRYYFKYFYFSDDIFRLYAFP